MDKMFFDRLRMNNNIIKINQCELPLNLGQYYVHCPLKGRWRILQPEGHAQTSEESPVARKGGFVLIMVIDLHLPVATVTVQGGEYRRLP